MRLLLFTAILHVIAGVIGVLLARRRRDYLPVALFLACTAVADVILVALTVGAPTTLPSAPLTGLPRFVGHVRQGLYLVWPFGFAALFVAVFSRRRTRAFSPAYAVAITGLVLGYPTLGGERLREAYLIVELAALAVAVGASIQWLRRRESTTLPHTVALLLLSSEIAVFLGPWHRDIFAGWDMGRTMYAITYAAIALVQGGFLWRPSRSS
jgi:hypothetical protein